MALPQPTTTRLYIAFFAPLRLGAFALKSPFDSTQWRQDAKRQRRQFQSWSGRDSEDASSRNASIEVIRDCVTSRITKLPVDYAFNRTENKTTESEH